MNLLPQAKAADFRRGNSCRRGERLQIQDLDVSPDPVMEEQRIHAFKVRIHFDGRRKCETEIYVREGNNIVGNARNYRLRPGIDELEIPAGEGFRLRAHEHCFNVQVDLAGSQQQIDANRRFCATQRTFWSMREPDDRGSLKH